MSPPPARAAERRGGAQSRKWAGTERRRIRLAVSRPPLNAPCDPTATAVTVSNVNVASEGHVRTPQRRFKRAATTPDRVRALIKATPRILPPRTAPPELWRDTPLYRKRRKRADVERSWAQDEGTWRHATRCVTNRVRQRGRSGSRSWACNPLVRCDSEAAAVHAAGRAIRS